MIPAAPLSMQHRRWQQAWREAVRDPRELLALLGLEQAAESVSAAAAAQFPLRVPRGFVARMRHGDINDPLLRQVLPLNEEIPFCIPDRVVFKPSADVTAFFILVKKLPSFKLKVAPIFLAIQIFPPLRSLLLRHSM